ncbi:MAG: hypothetical protein IJY28_05160 [Clostridia bacterium]|nr:hypothetical protein [Clostridia bacterium]
MEALGGIVLAVLCIAGMTWILQLVCDWLLSPEEDTPMIMLVPIQGHCEDAEMVLRSAVHRIRQMGDGTHILLCVDCGMDAETRVICSRICMDEAVPLIEPERITSYFRCNIGKDDV